MCDAYAKLIITNKLGLHARPAMAIKDTVDRYECTITLTRLDSGESADAASVLSLLRLAVTCGTELSISAAGADAADAVQALLELMQTGFEEFT